MTLGGFRALEENKKKFSSYPLFDGENDTMSKVKNINLTPVEFFKLGKHKQIRCGNVRIRINELPTKEVKLYGKLKC